MTSNEHLFKIKIDDAGVISSLRSLGAEISKISSQAVAAAIPNFASSVPTSLPQGVSASQIGAVIGNSQAQIARLIASGSPKYDPSKGVSSKITNEVAAAFKVALDPLLKSLDAAGRKQLTLSRREAINTFETAYKSGSGAQRSLFESFADPEEDPVAARAANLRRAGIIADATRQDAKAFNDIVTGRRKLAELTDAEVAAVARERSLLESSVKDAADLVEAKKALKAEIDRELRLRRQPIQGPTRADFTRIQEEFNRQPILGPTRDDFRAIEDARAEKLRRSPVLGPTRDDLNAVLNAEKIRNQQVDKSYADRQKFEKEIESAYRERASQQEELVIDGRKEIDAYKQRVATEKQADDAAQLRARQQAEAARRQRVNSLPLQGPTRADLDKVLAEQKRKFDALPRLGPDRSDLKKIEDEQKRRFNALRVQGPALPRDIVANAADSRKGRLIGRIGSLEEDLGRPTTETKDLINLSNSQLKRIVNQLSKRLKAEEAAATAATSGPVLGPTATDFKKIRDKEIRDAQRLQSEQDRVGGLGVFGPTRDDYNQAYQARFKNEPIQGPVNIAGEALDAINRERVNAARQLLTLEQRTAYDYQQLGALAAARKRSQAELQTAEFREMRGNREFMEVRAQRIIEERKYINEQRKINAQVAREQGFGGGNVFTRFLGRFSGGDNGGPLGPTGGIPPTLTEFFGRGAANLARYAVPGAIGYGAINGIKNTIKEAEELDRIFKSIESQFEASFGAQAQGKFAAFRSEILDIARDTGVAADEIANIGFQLQGAFSTRTIDGVGGSILVKEQLRASAEISKVTGLSAKEITDSLTAASIAFDASFRDIGNVTIDLQDRFGVLSKEIIPFLGDIAPVAKEAGFSLEEFATIAAVTQQQSGRSGSSLAEAYGRVIPAIAGARQQLVSLASTNNLSPDFVEKVSSGSIKDVFFAVAENMDKMNQSSKEFVINLLGGRREAAAILPVFGDAEKLLAEINKTEANSGNDTLASRFEKISQTLTESLARLEERFRQLGVAVFEAGLGDALVTLVNILSELVNIFEKVFSAIGGINEALGDMPVKILAAYAAFRLLASVSSTFAATSLGGRVLGSAAPAIAAGGVARRGASTAVTGSVLNAAEFYGLAGGEAVASGANSGATAAAYSRGFKGKASAGLAKFKSGLGVAGGVIATLAVAELVNYSSQVAAAVEAEKQNIAETATKDLEGQLSNESNPLSGNAFSDFKYGFEKASLFVRGKDTRTADKRFNIERELTNRKNTEFYEESGIADLFNQAFTDEKTVKEIFSKLQESDQEALKTAIGRAYDVKIGKKVLGVFDYNKSDPTNQDFADNKKVKEVYQKIIDGDVDTLNYIFQQAQTDPGYNELISALTGGALNTPEGQAAFDKIKTTMLETSELAQAQQRGVSLEQLKEEFQSGGNIAAYLDGLEKEAIARKKALEAVKKVGGDTDAWLKSYNEIQKEIAGIRSKAAFELSDFGQELFEVGAGKGDVSDQQNIDRLLGLIKSGTLNPEDRLKAARQIISLLQGLDKDTEIPPEVRQILAESFTNENINQEWASIANQIRNSLGAGADELIVNLQNAITGIALGNGAVGDIAAILAGKIEPLLSIAGDELAAAGGSGDTGGTALLATLQQLEAFALKIANATAGKVPSIAKSSKSGSDTAEELADARADYFRALIEGDPVALAEFNLQEAERAIGEAQNEAERYRAMADKVRAERALESARFDVDTGWADLWVAYYEYYGNNVKAAEAALEQAFEARRRVDELAKTGGAGSTDVLKAEADLLRAKANVRDTQLAEQKDEYQFLYDMGKITRAQLVSYLEGLKQIPDLTAAQIRDIDREIKQLQGELAQDLQFNLPSQFRLPTLYEVRRVGQTGSSQAGYVDNRNVVITLNVNNGATQQQMVQLLTDVVSGAPRVSSGTKRY